jgi:hypothetical protein
MMKSTLKTACTYFRVACFPADMITGKTIEVLSFDAWEDVGESEKLARGLSMRLDKRGEEVFLTRLAPGPRRRGSFRFAGEKQD